jgi:hypothetical protein
MVDPLDDSRLAPPQLSGRRLEILVLLQFRVMHINAVRDYVEAFDLFSRHSVTYAHGPMPGKGIPGNIDYREFDVLLIPHHCRVCSGDECFDDKVSNAIKQFAGYKVLIIQDEYDRTEIARQWIIDHGIHHVFTVVPEADIEKVYDPQRFGGTRFTNFLTGYIPPGLDKGLSIRPMEERPLHIVYRCREQGAWRGELCHQKLEIAKVVRRRCEERGLPVDIEWAEEKLIFGTAWNNFLQSGRATLGSESGSNVFDLDGSITRKVLAALDEHPELEYQDLVGKYFEDENIGVQMNQISPKFFEFIASKTALILFEGEYSGILEAGIHYLPLKRDFSNLEETLETLEDIPLLEEMAERAYSDVVASGKYHYQVAVGKMDYVFEEGTAKLAANLSPEERQQNSSAILRYQPSNISSLWKRELACSGVAEIVNEEISKRVEKSRNFSGMVSRRKEKIQAMLDKKPSGKSK